MHAVGQMPAVSKRQSHESITGLENRKEHGRVSLRTRMRLHINRHFNTGWLAKELLGSFNGKTFNFVNKFAAAVVALARIAFGIFVGEAAPLSSHHCRRSIIFARNQLDVLLLALSLGINPLPEFWVALGGAFGQIEHGLFPSVVKNTYREESAVTRTSHRQSCRSAGSLFSL